MATSQKGTARVVVDDDPVARDRAKRLKELNGMTDPRCAMKAIDNFIGAPVEVSVGLSGERFYVHEGILRSNSAFFDLALKQSWGEGQIRKTLLPEDDARAFSAYMSWLYSGQIPSPDNDDDGSLFQAQLYALGEKLMDAQFQNRVTDCIIASCRITDGDGECSFPPVRAVRKIFESRPPNSPARRLMVDIYTYHGTEHWTDECSSHVPLDFSIELNKAMLAMRGLSQKAADAKYREIDKGIPCFYYKPVEQTGYAKAATTSTAVKRTQPNAA